MGLLDWFIPEDDPLRQPHPTGREPVDPNAFYGGRWKPPTDQWYRRDPLPEGPPNPTPAYLRDPLPPQELKAKPDEPSTLEKVGHYLYYDNPATQFVRSLYSGATAPGDALTRGMTLDEAKARGNDVATAMTIASSGVRPDPNTAGMFVGAGARHIPEIRQRLTNAILDLASGTHPDDVWRKFGAGREHFSGNPITEISDQRAPIRLNPQTGLHEMDPVGYGIKPDVQVHLNQQVPGFDKQGQPIMVPQRWQGKLSDAVQHPEALAAYPKLGDINLDLGLGPFAGHYEPATNTIKVTAPYLDSVGDQKDMHSILLHEMQHHIQLAEGWPFGSNLTIGTMPNDPDAQNYDAAMKVVAAQRKKDYKISQTKSGAVATQAWQDYIDGGKKLDILQRMRDFKQAYAHYIRNPGEQMAGNTQLRADMDMATRMAQTPESTQQYPYSEQQRVWGPQGYIHGVVKAEPDMPSGGLLGAMDTGQPSGGVMGTVAQAVDPDAPPPAPKMNKAQREAAQLEDLTNQTRSLFDMTARPQDVPQHDIPRYDPPRGVPQRITDLTSNPVVRQRMLEYMRRGIHMSDWYNLEPLRKAFVNEFGDQEGTANFNKYLDYFAASSPKSTVPENLRNASFYYGLDMRGEPLPTPYVNEKGKLIKNPPPYGHLAQNTHRINFGKISSGEGLDMKTNAKPLGFAEDLKGNLTPVAVDAHAFRLPAMLSEDPRFLETSYKASEDAAPRNFRKDFEEGRITMQEALQNPTYWEGMPGENEYAAMERYYQGLAHELGLRPGEGQASAWVGGGPLTGLRSDANKTAMQMFIDRVAYTAQKRGLDPGTVLRQMMRAENPLLSLIGGGGGLIGAMAAAHGGAPQPTRQEY